MKLTVKAIRQFLIITALMSLALLAVNSLGADVALAQFVQVDDKPAGVAEGTFRQTVLDIVNYALGFLGLLAVVMVIYGGFLYVSSAGNEENVGKAKKILLYAAIGIVVILISWTLVNAVLSATTGEPR